MSKTARPSKIVPRFAGETTDNTRAKERGKNRDRTPEEIEHQSQVAELGCVVCRINGRLQHSPTEIHHVRKGRLRADCHYDVIPLCHDDHVGKGGAHGDKSEIRKLGFDESELLEIVKELMQNKGLYL